MQYALFEQLVRRDPRYALEAYEFAFAALRHTERMLGLPASGQGQAAEEVHVAGRQLLEGVRDLAREEFGLMAPAVFHAWGIHTTDDFGEVIFNLIEGGLMSRSETDRAEDFRAVFDLDDALTAGYTIEIPREPQDG